MLKVGLQLFTVRNHMAADWRRTLTDIAEAGYRHIEVANHHADVDDGIGFGVDAKEMKKILDDQGLKVCGAHVHPFIPERMGAVIEYQKIIGNDKIISPMEVFRTMDDVKRCCEVMNQMAELCKKEGMRFYYHNHYHEWQILPGETKSIYDTILESTDPDQVEIELDTYWALRANQNPVELIRKMGRRITMLHQKDFPKEYRSELDLLTKVNETGPYVDHEYFRSSRSEGSFTEIGSGIMDIQGIIDAANEVGAAEYIVLEQDFSTFDEIESIHKSMEGFRKFEGIAWD